MQMHANITIFSSCLVLLELQKIQLDKMTLGLCRSWKCCRRSLSLLVARGLMWVYERNHRNHLVDFLAQMIHRPIVLQLSGHQPDIAHFPNFTVGPGADAVWNAQDDACAAAAYRNRSTGL